MTQGGAPADSFNIQGDIEMAFFPGREDAYHTRINGERVETFLARMLGFPSEAEFEAALAGEVSPDPNVPVATRVMKGVSISVHRFDESPLF